MKSEAPWTDEQVEKLREWQKCGWVHPFTCKNSFYHRESSCALAPTKGGWWCGICGKITQTWAHDFMMCGPPPHPFRKSGE